MMERDSITRFYDHEIEANRLEQETFKLEGLRTKEIIERYIPETGLEILDIGGGAGYYSFWLQQKGHNVTLIDLSPRNIELAKNRSETMGPALKRLEAGDAVNLPFQSDQFDIVLLLGPLYHLTEPNERIAALSEARRVLKPNGTLLTAVISRYASLIDGFQKDLVYDDKFFSLMVNDLATGVHVNQTDNLQYFTTAYFHTPTEIMWEILESDLRFEKLIPVESFGWVVKNFSEKEKQPDYMTKLLSTIRMVEGREDLIAISPHIIAVAKKE